MGGLVIRELKFSPHITATVNLLQRKPVQAATKAPERLIGTAEGNLAVVGDQALPAVRKKRIKRPESLG